jgi:predicted component of type VI protein secretion system
MTPALVIKEGPLAGQRVEVNGELVVGREDAGLTIDDDEMSRRHAVLRPTGDGVEIEDLGSTNGTFVNGVKIAQVTRLKGGDSIRLGQSVVQVELAAAPAAAAPAPQAAAAAPAAAPPPRPAAAPVRAPSEAFGAYAAPAANRGRGIASRQLGPQLASFAVVAATAVALVLYFAEH